MMKKLQIKYVNGQRRLERMRLGTSMKNWAITIE